MLAPARFFPVLRSSLRQIVPPVLATLIAALLIAGFNRAFSGHLVQPRMAALHSEASLSGEAPRPASAAAQPSDVATEVVDAAAPPAAFERIYAKDDGSEAGKDQTAVKPIAQAAAAVAPAPPAPHLEARKIEPRPAEPRTIEPRLAEPRYAAVVVAPPPAITVAPVPVVAQPMAPVMTQPVAQLPVAQLPVTQEPPAVIVANPTVTVPDRARPPYEAASAPEAAPPAPQGGPLGRIVETLRPSSIFARMREFGDRIEAAGNDILPNIRP